MRRRAPRIPGRSPTGAPTCPSSGPLDAELLLVGESPAGEEIRDQEPFVGPAGRVLALGMSKVGLPRAKTRIVNAVPALAPGNKFAQHDPRDLAWGINLLRQEIAAMPRLRLVVALGDNPMRLIQGTSGIMKWRGSLIPAVDRWGDDPGDPNEYWRRLSRSPEVPPPDSVATMGTYHPAAVLRQFAWHYWLNNDLGRARDYLSGNWTPPHKRQWFFNDMEELERVVDEVILPHEHMFAMDTEMSPPICCIVTEDEVHTFEWQDRAYEPMRRILTHPRVLKVAHNMAHDWRQSELWWGIQVERPWFDTLAGAHILEPSGMDPGGDREEEAGEQLVGKALSPHITTRFTPWPYHKWLDALDPLVYCGIDTVTCYDAYWPQMKALNQRPQLMRLAEEDHRVWEVLFHMQRRGVLVDEAQRSKEEERLQKEVGDWDQQLQDKAGAIVQEAWGRGRLSKPDLFRKEKVCPCCRSSKKKSPRCWSCAGFQKAPSKKELVERATRTTIRVKDALRLSKMTKGELEELLLHPCARCSGDARKQVHWVDINWGSGDQVGDIFYRALGVPARRYQGRETTRFEQLERLLDPGQYLAPGVEGRRAEARELLTAYVKRAKVATDLATVQRLTPDEHGILRSVFDPWYTPTARVASREGLFDVGTNLQNIPKEARRMIVARPGYVYLYPDYAQIEGRAVAVTCKDEAFMRIYADPDGDSHTEVVKLMASMGVVITRDQAKRLSYAVMYGIEAEHLGVVLGVDFMTARRILDAFFRVFRGVKRYHEQIKKELRAHRRVTCPTGWTRRWLGHVVRGKGRLQGELIDKVIKEALATIPQHMAARVLTKGLLRIWAGDRTLLDPAAHVHDAALLESPADRAGEALLASEEAMTLTEWGMPFPVEASVGPNWYVASLSNKDDEKLPGGVYHAWSRDQVLANGVPG